MHINEYRDDLVEAVNAKYPKKWSLENRYISLTKQVSDFGQAIMFMNGSTNVCHTHDTPKHLLAAIMVDIFMLSELLDADLDIELLRALCWFLTGSKNLHLDREELIYIIRNARQEKDFIHH